MASAVLPSRNEQCWGEQKTYTGNYPNDPTNKTRITTRFNPNTCPIVNPYPNLGRDFTRNPNSNLIRETHDLKNHPRQRNEPTKRLSTLPPSSSPVVFSDPQLSHQKPEGLVPPKDPFHREYLTFNLASYSNVELKKLKKRLMSELQSVRSLLTLMEARSESRLALPNPQFMLPPPPPIVSETFAEKRTPKGIQQSGSSGFVTRNDKIKKKITGQKRTLHFATGPGSTCSMVSKSEALKVENAMMTKCKQILMKLLKLKHAFIFSKPVDVQGLKLHDYYQIIKQPMDLGTVKSKMSNKEYQTPLDFASDVRLTFENALKYNPKGHEVHTLADAMLMKFEGLFQTEYEKYETEYRNVMTGNLVNQKCSAAKPMALVELVNQNSRVTKPMAMVEGTETMRRLLKPMISSHPVQVTDLLQLGSGKLPKPKAKDPNKRPMTSEEKLKLVSHLENISPEMMKQVVQIVQRRNPELLQEGSDIELNVEALNIEALWELDMLVNNHKMSGGKIERPDLIENASLGEIPKSLDYKASQLPEVYGQKNKKWDDGEEDIDIGEELPADDFPRVEIEKDPAGGSSGSSSSGSSSSDDSSSSDSDSGSSSGSDSDEDSV